MQWMEGHLIKVNLHLRGACLLSVQSLELNKVTLMTIIFWGSKGCTPG